MKAYLIIVFQSCFMGHLFAQTKPITEWVNIPTGTFIMGSPMSDVDRQANETQHQVTLGAFKMSKYEIIFKQYDMFCETTGRKKPYDAKWGRGNRPILHSQYYSRKEIINEASDSITIVVPPAFDVSIGLSNSKIFKVDLNYITRDKIVYGGAIGIRPCKTSVNAPEDATANVFLGYDLAECAIIGTTVGVTHVTNLQYRDGNNCIKFRTGIKFSLGMSLKFISTYTKIPITFGAFGSNAGIGMTIGTIF